MEKFPHPQLATADRIDRAVGMAEYEVARDLVRDYIESGKVNENTQATHHVIKLILGLAMHEANYAIKNRGRLASAEMSDDIRERIAKTYSNTATELNFSYALLEDYHRNIERVKEEVATNHYMISIGGHRELIQESEKRASDQVGMISELAFFALMTRDLDGSNADAYTVVPSSLNQDMGKRRADGLRTGFDFSVYQIDTDKTIEVQVKTSGPYVLSQGYRRTLEVVSMSSLMEDMPDRPSVNELAVAIIDDNDGAADEAQINLINHATARLHERLGTHSRIEQLEMTA